MPSRIHLSLIFAAFACTALPQGYKNTDLRPDVRARDLVRMLTLEEKVGQMQHGAPAIRRLGIPAYNWWSEALHGVARAGLATVFPQSIGLGATWNPELLHEVAVAIADEGRAKHHDAVKRGVHDIYTGLTFWSPNINIFRDPRWGRGHETYGEDPYLTARMGVAFVKGLQGDHPTYFKTIATAKHYAVHSGPEPIRTRFNAIASVHDLWDTYLPAFEATVVEGKAYSVMSAYNRINGLPASSNPILLDQILRKRWGFEGYVVSDCGAIYNIFQDHKVVATAEEASAAAVNAGCDLECGEAYAALVRAVRSGLISESTIDRAVARLFEARIRLGMFDPPSSVPFTRIPMSVVDSAKHRALALKAARQSIVLLKNERPSKNRPRLLPLSKNLKTIAVIGPNADAAETLLGNYNGTPSFITTPLEGIRNKVGGKTKVIYARGAPLTPAGLAEPVPASALPGGMRAEYFNNKTMSGEPVLRRVDQKVDFDWGESAPAPGVNRDDFSVRWTGTLVPITTGVHQLGVRNDDGMRLYLDGKRLINDWSDNAPRTTTVPVRLEKGRRYQVTLEYYESRIGAVAQFLWSPPADLKFTEAVAAAQKADVVVMVLGISPELENEGLDRTAIELPQIQLDLLKAVHKTKKPIVLVLVNGGPVSIPWAADNIPAIVEAWYGGQSAGDAVADVLFGDYNPSGKMPVTVYRSTRDLPSFTDYSMRNRTYRYYGGTPLYPFGHGLSYTSFSHRTVSSPKQIEQGKPIRIKMRVTNTGKRAGEEVVQLYVTWRNRKPFMPYRELRGFRRVNLRPGQSTVVEFVLAGRDLSYVNQNGDLVEGDGSMQVSIGGSQPQSVPVQVRVRAKAVAK
jgi:beta-glucosidase